MGGSVAGRGAVSDRQHRLVSVMVYFFTLVIPHLLLLAVLGPALVESEEAEELGTP